MSKVLPWVMFTVFLGLIISEIYVMKNKDRGAVCVELQEKVNE